MAKRNEKLDEAKVAAAEAELAIIAAAEAKAAEEAKAKSNFAGSAEAAFDEAFKRGEEDGTGKAALLATGIIAAKYAKVLRGKVVKGKEDEFQANIFALRMKYVEGYNRIAAKLNPLDMIAVDPDEKSKAYKANKKQANKLGTFVKAGCLFDKPEDAETYINKVVATLATTDFSKAKTRESTFERVARVIRGADASTVKESDEALAERCKPEEKEEESTTTEETAAAAPAEVAITASEALSTLGSQLSVIVAKYGLTGTNATKLNAMAHELDAMAKMLHAADKAEQTAASSGTNDQTAQTNAA